LSEDSLLRKVGAQPLTRDEEEELAVKDGFHSAVELFQTLAEMHSWSLADIFQVIRWGKLEQTNRVGCSAVESQRERLV
jgi:hypothetical protein